MTDSPFLEAVRNVPHDATCVLLTLDSPNYAYGVRLECDCTRDARIACAIPEALSAYLSPGDVPGLTAALRAFTRAASESAPPGPVVSRQHDLEAALKYISEHGASGGHELSLIARDVLNGAWTPPA